MGRPDGARGSGPDGARIFVTQPMPEPALARLREAGRVELTPDSEHIMMLEGPEKFARFVVIEFPSLEQAVACYNSPEYQAAAAFRKQGAGEVELVIVEGGDATPV